MHNGMVKVALLGEIYYLSNHRISVFGCQFSVFGFLISLLSNVCCSELVLYK
jgi:hypothetical protein